MEISRPLPGIDAVDEAAGIRYRSALVLVRQHTEPLGLVRCCLRKGGLEPADLRDRIWATLGERITTGLREDGAEVAPGAESRYLRERGCALADGPRISVIVCTRDRVAALSRCLDSLSVQSYRPDEIVVVDNAPTTDEVAALLASRKTDVPVRRVVEPRPGLARARNRGLASASGEAVAYIDDDEIADEHWLREIAYAFRTTPEAACVTGMILPACLDNAVQTWFEEYGGHSKGRGFTRQVFDPREPGGQSPLYPLPAFGAGGNMAFTRRGLEAIGGFDPALGAGTPTKGGEDTAAFTDVLLRGEPIVYQPSAFVWHQHYSDLAGLRGQLYGYGAGLTSYYTRILVKSPWRIAQLVALLPTGLRDMRSPDSVRHATMSDAFPADLLRAHRQGMLSGPMAYLGTRIRQAVKDRSFSRARSGGGRPSIEGPPADLHVSRL